MVFDPVWAVVKDSNNPTELEFYSTPEQATKRANDIEGTVTGPFQVEFTSKGTIKIGHSSRQASTDWQRRVLAH